MRGRRREMVVPPFRFGLVESNVFRCAQPTLKNYRFISRYRTHKSSVDCALFLLEVISLTPVLRVCTTVRWHHPLVAACGRYSQGVYTAGQAISSTCLDVPYQLDGRRTDVGRKLWCLGVKNPCREAHTVMMNRTFSRLFLFLLLPFHDNVLAKVATL